jgi:hypothetical protein
MANLFKSEYTGEFFEKDFFYFTSFPTVKYDILHDGKTQAIRNFLKRFGFRKDIRDNAAAFSMWVIRDEDTPEVIAHRLYNSTHLYWIVLMLNQILDPIFGWPLSDRQLYQYCVAHYGIENVYEHHHWEAQAPTEVEDYPAGIIVSESYPHKVSVSNYAHEFQTNEDKRSIKLLKPEYLPDVMTEWDSIKDSNFTDITY